MNEYPGLSVTSRHGIGSASSRRLREQQRIPGILYGHGDPTPVIIDAYAFRHLVKPPQYGSLIIHLQLDGRDIGNALVKSVHTSPVVGHQIMHVDLQRVTQEDRVKVNVPITLVGDAAGTRRGGVLEQSIHALNIRCNAAAVPDSITYDISAMEIADAVHVRDLPLPKDSELLDEPAEVVAVVIAPTIPALEEQFDIVEEGGQQLAA